MRVEIRSPGPGFAPVADRAIQIALLGFAKRADRVDFVECVLELKTLVEIGLGFLIGGRDRTREFSQSLRVERHRFLEVVWNGRCGIVIVLRVRSLAGGNKNEDRASEQARE